MFPKSGRKSLFFVLCLVSSISTVFLEQTQPSGLSSRSGQWGSDETKTGVRTASTADLSTRKDRGRKGQESHVSAGPP